MEEHLESVGSTYNALSSLNSDQVSELLNQSTEDLIEKSSITDLNKTQKFLYHHILFLSKRNTVSIPEYS